MLWVDKFTGDATVWYNNGELPDGGEMNGSKFHWVNSGKLYQGSSRGPNMHYPNLGGQGRADMVEVDPQTAKVSSCVSPFVNTCGERRRR